MNYSVDAFWYAAIRFAIYAAVLGLLGACAFVLLVVRRVRGLGLSSDLYAEEATAKAKRMAVVCACVLAVTVPARLIAQSLVLFDAPFDIGPAIPITNWGRAWLLQVAGIVLAFVALAQVRGMSVRAWRVAAVGGAAVALMMAIGAINWRMLKPKLGTEPAARAIRRSALREVTVAAFIVLTTAYLVASSPHGDEAMDSATAATTR